MRPTSSELIRGIAAALEGTVLPALGEDRWAASTVRSAMTLLAHLAERVRVELPLVLADNEDAADTLQAVVRGPRPAAANPALFAAIADLLAEPAPVSAHDLDVQEALNRRYQALIEKLLRDCRDAAHMHAIHAELNAYLRRRAERERPLYFPAFTKGAPF